MTSIDPLQAAAGLFILACWLAYGRILAVLGRRPINIQLASVRRQWVLAISRRQAKPFDAVLIGHVTNAAAFFGSATLIVLAGLLTGLLGLERLHTTLTGLGFVAIVDRDAFAMSYGLVLAIVTACFLTFTYALRKFVYAIALIGALPEDIVDGTPEEAMATEAAVVLTEAIKTFNLGIRGFYYAIAALFLFISPGVAVGATLLVTAMLVYRQIGTRTARAIAAYVALQNRDAGDRR